MNASYDDDPEPYTSLPAAQEIAALRSTIALLEESIELGHRHRLRVEEAADVQ